MPSPYLRGVQRRAEVEHAPEESLTSDIREIVSPFSRPRTRRTQSDVEALRPSPNTARFLVEHALEQALASQSDEARRAVRDASDLVDGLGVVAYAKIRAELSTLLGETYLHLHDAHEALRRFQAASIYFERTGDLEGRARTRLGVARALLAIGDPSGRAVLEDAGELYEDLRDEEAVRTIDRELRAIAADFEESPSSFAAANAPFPRG